MSDATTPDSTGTGTGAETPPLCRCGATERHVDNPNMCAGGHFISGNAARRIHGVRAFETTGRVPDVLRQTVEEFREAVIADRNGAADLTVLEAAYVRRLSEAETVARLLASDLASRGLFTPRGRVRNTFQRWTEAVSLWDRLAQRVGVDRRARAVPDLMHYMASEPQHEAGA